MINKLVSKLNRNEKICYISGDFNLAYGNFKITLLLHSLLARVRNRRMERDGRESILFDHKGEQEVDKEREEEILEGEGEKRDEDTSDGEEVDEGRDTKKWRVKTEGKQQFGQQRDQGNLHERIAAMKNTLQEFQELRTAYLWLMKICCVLFDDDDDNDNGHIMGTIVINDIAGQLSCTLHHKREKLLIVGNN